MVLTLSLSLLVGSDNFMVQESKVVSGGFMNYNRLIFQPFEAIFALCRASQRKSIILFGVINP